MTIAETVNAKYQSGSNAGETMEMTPLEGQIYWIVDISVKNKSYENPVTGPWKIVADDKVYNAQRPFMGIQSAYPLSVAMGEAGKTIIRFPVSDTLKVSDAKLCYQGQEPYSYGKLTGGNKVAVYDWDLKKAVPEEAQKEEKQQAVFYEKWEFTLNSFSIKSTDVNVNISVTSHFDAPREYDAYRIVLIDQYYKSSGMIFGDTIDKKHFYGFYEGIYYPGDTKTGNLRFVVNPKSGKVSLCLYSPLWRSIMGKLFDLGEIK